MNSTQPSQPWKVLRDFSDPTTGIAVRVTAQENHRIRFSIKIGRFMDQPDSNVQAFIPFIPIYIDVDKGKVMRRDATERVVERLMLEAFEFIHEKAQDREDIIMDGRIQRELKQANQGKAPTRRTGKTERDNSKQKTRTA